ncbi:polysaccharide lyase family 8 super-sandwich domain-containing protein [Chitinimonas koreensis]|uniref:polysaccharide lyase family 8 super-sandwich domain-containing protein n=1 Tax=Chitinimonas koreensis TaxID=356302 RepID=UPI0003FA4B11|nr:polysaccharide lyase family 8 super-sandwich domain-containing protein [Chitinimonas koreensis]QNM98787.1 polysaccharide lyase 8 family protein [Chitinimonas koreensis]
MHLPPIPPWRALLAAWLTLLALLGTAAQADEYDTLRNKWITVQTGGPGIDTANPDIAAAIVRITATAQTAWNNLHKEAGRTRLWDDVGVTDNGSDAAANYARLRSMAIAYATTGSSLQGDPALAADIVAALDWMHANLYNTGTVITSWADLEFAASQASMTTALLVYDQLNATQVANYTAAVDRFVPDCSNWISKYNTVSVATGGNLVDLCLAVALRGILGKNGGKIAAAASKISPVFLYVASGDGFYLDGSFIQHSTHAYMGGYGTAVIGGLSSLFILLNGSSWAITDPNAGNVWNWMSKAIVPLVFNGAMTDAVKGRGVSRCGPGDHGTGRAFAQYLLRFANGAPAAQAAYLKGVAKAWASQDTSWNGYVDSCSSPGTSYTNYYSGLPPYDIANFTAVMNDASIVAASPLNGNFNFAGMQRVTHFAPGFGIALSTFSKKISAFECGSSENWKGWYTGLGMTYFYTADQAQFNGNFWPTVNLTRLPGVTTDGSTKVPACNYENVLNTYDWVGNSAVDGLHGSAGMQFTLAPVTGSTLAGKKSWFFFGDKMVALGSGIASSSAGAVETVVDNRKLLAAGNNVLTVNGASQPATLGWSATLPGVSWAHLDGNVAGAGIGYYFPGTASLYALRESRSGKWSDINTNSGPTTTYGNNFLSLAVPHGNAPSNGSYAYVVLPNRTAATTAAFAAAPTIQVLENSQEAHAARDIALNVTGVNFWNDAGKTVMDGALPYLASNRKASVTLRESGGQLSIGVSDPTQANTGSITLEIGRRAASLISADAGVTVNQLSPTLRLTVNVNGSAGKTFNVKFGGVSLYAPKAVGAAADAYVRGGSYAATAFGFNGYTVVTHSSSADWIRQGLYRFDLPATPAGASIASVQIRLTADGVPTTAPQNRAFLLAGNGWAEGSVTWNSKPALASATPLASWATPTAVGTPVTFDVTAAAVNAMAGDKKLSILLDSLDSSGTWVSYSTRENANPVYRPVLIVNYN